MTLIVALMTASGCSAGSSGTAVAPPASPPSASPSATATGPTAAEQARAYLAATAPANAAITDLNAKATAGTSQAELAAAAEHAATVMDGVTQSLARIGFTGAAATDVRTLIGAIAQMVNDLRGVRSQTAFSAQAFATQLGRDAASMSAGVTLLRADLGLPPKAA